MSRTAPPLRFLLVVVGGWVFARAAILFPGWTGFPQEPRPAMLAQTPPFERIASPAGPRGTDPPPRTSASRALPRLVPATVRVPADLQSVVEAPGVARRDVRVPAIATAPDPPGPPWFPALPPLARVPGRRWTASAWLFLRGGSGGQLGTAGTLGGSQAGVRAAYRINSDLARPLAVVARLSSPRSVAGAEAALGVEYQLVPAVPARLLVERRQALGRDGRSAFALIAYGGVTERRLVGPVTLDGYVQAGVVGLHARDRFIDGSAVLGTRLIGDVRVGAGIWGAAQPDVARLDVGPQLSLPIHTAAGGMRLSAEWRVRVAGDARPATGPALTLAADF